MDEQCGEDRGHSTGLVDRAYGRELRAAAEDDPAPGPPGEARAVVGGGRADHQRERHVADQHRQHRDHALPRGGRTAHLVRSNGRLGPAVGHETHRPDAPSPDLPRCRARRKGKGRHRSYVSSIEATRRHRGGRTGRRSGHRDAARTRGRAHHADRRRRPARVPAPDARVDARRRAAVVTLGAARRDRGRGDAGGEADDAPLRRRHDGDHRQALSRGRRALRPASGRPRSPAVARGVRSRRRDARRPMDRRPAHLERAGGGRTGAHVRRPGRGSLRPPGDRRGRCSLDRRPFGRRRVFPRRATTSPP